MYSFFFGGSEGGFALEPDLPQSSQLLRAPLLLMVVLSSQEWAVPSLTSCQEESFSHSA